MKALFGILSVLCISATSCLAERDYYTAAVLEKRDETDVGGSQVVERSLEMYSRATELAAEKKVDIIVFSEFGLHPYIEDKTVLQGWAQHVPDPKQGNHNPCNERDKYIDRNILLTLSCLAQKYKIYIAANMLDIQHEEMSCPAKKADDGIECSGGKPQVYNTDIAFNRNGDLIARYHKHYLYFEKLDTSTDPGYATFKTDFGHFGMIVCFDSLFKYTVDLIEKCPIDTLLFLTHWFDDIIPLNAIEWQQAMAINHKVNVIGANGMQPGLGTLGSGIFSKDKGVLHYTYNPDGKSKLIIAQIPLTQEASDSYQATNNIIIHMDTEEIVEVEEGNDFPIHSYFPIAGPAADNFTDYRHFLSLTEGASLIKLKPGRGRAEACHNEFCCEATYVAESLDEDEYYLSAFNGENNVRNYFTWAEETCLLLRCDPFEGTPCVAMPSQSKAVFKSVVLKAKFSTKHVYPAISTNNHRLVPKSEWSFNENEDQTELKFKDPSGVHLLKVGLMGRVYPKDAPFIPYYRY